MKTVNKKVTMTVELSGEEYEALRLLSHRIEKREEYINGEDWYIDLVNIVGNEYANAIAKMFEEKS